MIDCVVPVKATLSAIGQRLELKGKKFIIGIAASEMDIDNVWNELTVLDSSPSK